MRYVRFLILLLLPIYIFAVDPLDPKIVYLTWQHSPESTMTIQWITRTNDKSDLIKYRSQNQPQWETITGQHITFPEEYPFFVHRVELTGLQPDTEYLFRPGENASIYKFRTMPKELTKPLCFVVGGDVYHDGMNHVIKMCRQAAKTNPAFALVGGDIAYVDNNSALDHQERVERWFEFLMTWKKEMVTPDGCLIPILPAIGNHDIKWGFNQSPAEAQFFSTIFPMPGSQGYDALDFGDYLTVLILDSGHAHPVDGAQTYWLNHTLAERQQFTHKFALYHVGAYPSHRPFQARIGSLIRQHWVPIFEHFHLNAAFEHHDHTYKRTHPLRNGQIDAAGVLYLGDGAWGIDKPRVPRPPEQCWYLAKSVPVQHVIVVTIENSRRQYKAIDKNGRVVDHIIQKINSKN